LGLGGARAPPSPNVGPPLVVLAPNAPYVAAETMAGAMDLSFSSSASLEIFKLDFQFDDQELLLADKAPSFERFNRLSWGRAVAGSASDNAERERERERERDIEILKPHHHFDLYPNQQKIFLKKKKKKNHM